MFRKHLFNFTHVCVLALVFCLLFFLLCNGSLSYLSWVLYSFPFIQVFLECSSSIGNSYSIFCSCSIALTKYRCSSIGVLFVCLYTSLFSILEFQFLKDKDSALAVFFLPTTIPCFCTKWVLTLLHERVV